MKLILVFALAALLSGPALACNNPQGCGFVYQPPKRSVAPLSVQRVQDYFPERESRAPYGGGFREKVKVRCYQMGASVYCDER